MSRDKISTDKKIQQLKGDIYEYTLDKQFKHSESMGEIVKGALDFVKRNYQDESMRRLLES